ncbi:MAG: hypothetical protein AAGG80_05445, partial [Pseudomonadota bacterium]
FFIQSILGADLDSGHFLPSMAKNSGMTRTNWLFFDLRNNAFLKGRTGGIFQLIDKSPLTPLL